MRWFVCTYTWIFECMCEFFVCVNVLFILDYDSMCSETDYAQEKVNFHVLESPIPPLTAAALRMIIYKRPFPFG